MWIVKVQLILGNLGVYCLLRPVWPNIYGKYRTYSLGLNCLLRPVWPNTYDKYRTYRSKLFGLSNEIHVQSTLVISNSLISNNRLSRSENLVPVLTQRSTNRQQNSVEKRRNFSSFPQYFQYISNLGVKLHFRSVKSGCSINCFLHFANLICQSTDISKSFIESLGVRDNESRLYLRLIPYI